MDKTKLSQLNAALGAMQVSNATVGRRINVAELLAKPSVEEISAVSIDLGISISEAERYIDNDVVRFDTEVGKWVVDFSSLNHE